MRSTLFVITILFSLSACRNNGAGDRLLRKDTLSFRTDPIVGKFTLPYNQQVYADSNSLIFYYTKAFDTSFLVHLRKSNDEIVGTYYQTLPEIHRDLEGYSDDDTKFLFFDGFSFVINTRIWDSIKNSASELLSKDDSVRSKVCFDCTSYFLAYNTEILYDNKDNEIYFKKLSEYLKTTVIDKINRIRQEKFGAKR